MARIHRELYKKDLNDPDNHGGVITHLGPDILECKVKWLKKYSYKQKASGGDRIPVELFQILKDDAVRVLHSICQLIWKTQQWPQDWKRQFSFLVVSVYLSLSPVIPVQFLINCHLYLGCFSPFGSGSFLIASSSSSCSRVPLRA